MFETPQELTKKEQYDLKQQEKRQETGVSQKKRGLKRAVIWIFAFLLLGGAVFGAVKFGTSSPSTQTAALVNTVSDSDWTEGNKEAKVILVEYSDFQCPACGGFYPLVKQINQEYGSKLRFVYRHFPLPQHANAKAAAYAAEAAGKQNKFWEMHNMIFENQTDWSENSNAENIFLGYAKSLGLNPDQYKKDVDSKEVKNKVQSDYDGGVQSGINATPTFFLNGNKMQFSTYDEFRNTIKQALEIAK